MLNANGFFIIRQLREICHQISHRSRASAGLTMAYVCEHCVPSQDSIYFQIENLHRRLDETNDLLQYSRRSRANERHRRDKLAFRLKDIEGSVLQSVYKLESPRTSSSKAREKPLKGESLRSFVQWRKQLRILHDALEDAIGELSRVNTRKARHAIVELKELKEDVTSSLLQTAEWTQEDLDNLAITNTVGGYRNLPSTKKSLRSILNDAESVRHLSHKLSTQMKYELQGLKSECVAMVKDLVAMNRILEGQKRALVE